MIPYLDSLQQFGVKFGLESMSVLVAALGHPERAFTSVHVAGTNGKGSVTAMVDAGLRAAGHRSARYTSPHLVDVTERFVIDGHPVAFDELSIAVETVRVAVERLMADEALASSPTFFEVTTAVAFELFRRAGVETAVLEVGLGGRLDATNVVWPSATAITSIALDHQQYLGSTLNEIAVEKAGIIKLHVPVVVGPLEPEVLAAIAEVARARDAEIIQASADEIGSCSVGLRGRHQLANAAVAARLLGVLDRRGTCVPPSAIADGLAHPDWPGRLDLRRLSDGREMLLDAAHNPAGAEALASYLHEEMPDHPLVFGAMRDKDVDGMLRALLPAVDRVVFTRASNRRASDPAWLAECARRIASGKKVAVSPSPMEALQEAWRTSRRIVVAGSIFLLGDVLKELG